MCTLFCPQICYYYGKQLILYKNINIMETLSVRDYRNNLAASFDRADKGETVLIRRRNQIYTLTNIGKEDLMITPELQARIEEARKNYREGRYESCRTKEELESFLDSI